MAAVPEDEESLLPFGRDSEDRSRARRLEKTARWQGIFPSLFRSRGNRSRAATFMTLAVLATVCLALWMVYVYRP